MSGYCPTINFRAQALLSTLGLVVLLALPGTCQQLQILVIPEQIEVDGDTVHAGLQWENQGHQAQLVHFSYTVRSHFGRRLATGSGQFDIGPGEKSSLAISFPRDSWPDYRVELCYTDDGQTIERWCYIPTDNLGDFHLGGSRNTTNLLRGHYDWHWCYLDGPWERTMRNGGDTELPRENDEWTKLAYDALSFSNFNREAGGPHHAWYRTHFTVPEQMRGQQLFVLFESANYKTEAWLNGERLGEHVGAYDPFRFDVTDSVNLTGDNELLVLVTDWTAMARDYVYGVTKYEEKREGVYDYWLDPSYANRDESAGITRPVKLLATPAVRVEDVVIRTSVTDRRLTVIATLANDTDTRIATSFHARVLDAGQLAKSLPARQIWLAPGAVERVEVTTAWQNPKLWWPKSPHLYQLQTWLEGAGGVRLDRFDVRFGFREFGTHGKDFMLNGQPYKPVYLGVGEHYGTMPRWKLADAMRNALANGQRIKRLHGFIGRILSDTRYDIADETGMLIINEGVSASGFNTMRRWGYGQDEFWRRSRSFFSYYAHRVINHPSVVINSLVNEMFRCGAAGIHPNAQPGFVELAGYVQQIDPTRPTMYAGDGDPAGEDDPRVSIIDPHYPWPIVEANDFPADLRYLQTDDPIKRTRSYPATFKWTGKKPLTFTETEYLGEFDMPGGFALLGGESVYRSQWEWSQALEFGLIHTYRIYRQSGVAMICPWTAAPHVAEGALRPVSIFIMDLTPNFFSQERATRRLSIHHDVGIEGTEELVLRWKVTSRGRAVVEGEKTLTMAPAEQRDEIISWQMPQVSRPQKVELWVGLFRPGEQEPVHEDRQTLKVWPRVRLELPEGLRVGLFDQDGRTAVALSRAGLDLPAFEDPTTAELQKYDVVIIGADSLLSQDLTSLADFARSWDLRWYTRNGGRLIILSQSQTMAGEGTINQVRDWLRCPDGRVGFNVFNKPTPSSALPLLQCGANLARSPLLEIVVGSGRALVSQLDLVGKLETEPVAARVLQNMLNWAATAYPEPEPALLLDAADGELAAALSRIGISFTRPSEQVLSEEQLTQASVVIVSADSPLLPQATSRLEQFARGGGVVWLIGVTPQNVANLGNLVPTNLEVKARRPGQLIKTSLDPLLAGLSNDEFWWLPRGGVPGWNMGQFDEAAEDAAALLEYEIAPPRRFQFVSPNMKPRQGFTAVEPGMLYTEERGYGLLEPARAEGTQWTVELYHRPETWGGVRPTGRELAFRTDLPDGIYRVRMVAGLCQGSSTVQQISLEGRTYARGLQSPGPAELIDRTFIVPVHDGSLNVQLQYQSEQTAASLKTLSVEDMRLLTNPGGLMKLPMGEGFVLIDQIRWQQPAYQVADQAARIACTLATNLGIARQ